MRATRQSIEASLLEFIKDELLEESYDGRDPLATDAVDSLGLEQLVDYIEQKFGIAIGSEEMVRRHFGSIATLSTLIDSKLRQ
jgi:acyl carrier protein